MAALTQETMVLMQTFKLLLLIHEFLLLPHLFIFYIGVLDMNSRCPVRHLPWILVVLCLESSL